MIYSKTCEYAIRALMFLATQPKGTYYLTHVISKETGVPSAYLSKIFRDLTHHKILVSRRGASGGVMLASSPQDISIQKIVEIIDDPDHLKACVMGLNQCSDTNACPLHHVWTQSREKIVAQMQKCTLSAITKKVGRASYRDMKRGKLNTELFLSSTSH